MNFEKHRDRLHGLMTYRAASEALGIPYFKVQRAARQGLIPTYSILNGRKYVKLGDILDRMTPRT